MRTDVITRYESVDNFILHYISRTQTVIT